MWVYPAHEYGDYNISVSWSPIEVKLDKDPIVLGANEDDTVVSKEFGFSAEGALNCQIAIKASSVTSSTGITAMLQTAIGDLGWEDSKSTAITSNDVVYIKL